MIPYKLKIEGSEIANICKTCGTRYSVEIFNEGECPVCLDDRQYLKEYGQQWISYHSLKQKHRVVINQLHENVFELTIQPAFAIGQKAHLLVTEFGNILWDCIPLLDESSASFILDRGGLKAIAISHPHYYSLMAEWARFFNCPIYLHEDDRKWVMDPSDNIIFWQGERHKINRDINLIRIGGHFSGSAVLHLHSSQKSGHLLTGDTLYLSRDKKHITAMYSYPNFIPLRPEELNAIFKTIEKLDFDSLFGAFDWQYILKGAKNILMNSMERHQQIHQLG
ncbi:MAG TPA: hypothetical protein VKA27_03455 [Sunxiuqinia sp.]|nr:hypothetical protein [Sunxiuqinia sp.]